MFTETLAIVIVGGGWHTPEHYRKVRDGLEVLGFQVEIPSHPSLNGARPPTAGLAEDTANTRSIVQQLVEAGRRVVVVAHSYGGQVTSNSLSGLGFDTRKAQGLSGGVINIVYMCAFALPEGGSMFEFVKQMGHEAVMPIAFKFDDDKTVLCADPKALLIGDDAKSDELQPYLDSLVLWNGQCMYDEITSAAWREIPVTYIYTTKDITIPVDYQKTMVANLEENGRSVKTYTLNTGHCPNLTAAEQIVDILKEVSV